uniref:Uncharacterized protein n=1 Tax=Glycine max TaxID=3847 RepID=C6SY79_SOYBN|nr:unknown [Glycine max]
MCRLQWPHANYKIIATYADHFLCELQLSHRPLTFLIIMALSFLARSSDRIFRSKFFWAKTRFSEFLIWNLCSCFIILSIPLDCILRCINPNAASKFPPMTFTLMPLHCWSCCI